jgi:cell division transport system ATP-binding protein
MITFDQVSKQYNGLTALSDVSLEIPDAEFVFLLGPSGAGKSTLLKMIIREVVPTRGSIRLDETDIGSLSDSDVPSLRRKVGTVFQDFKLLPQKTVFENVAFPLEVIGLADDEIARTTSGMLETVNLADKATHFPFQISGGEAQRTAIARAMVLRPEVILADEPTGNLDPGSAWEVMQLLAKLNSLGTTVVMATHNFDISKSLPHREVEIQKGRVVRDSKQKGVKQDVSDKSKKAS